MLVLITVDGDYDRAFELDRVDAPMFIASRDEYELTAVVKNTGDVHGRLVGESVIKSPFGNTIAKLPVRTRLVLPGGEQFGTTIWDATPFFGIYKVRTKLMPDELDEPVLTDERWLIVLPPWWIWVIAVVIIVIAVWLWRRRDVDYDWLDDDEFDELDDDHDAIAGIDELDTE